MKEKYHEYQKMFSVESTLWWYRILHYLIYDTIKRILPCKEISILDAGCGTGGMMRYLMDRGYNNVQGFDVSKHAIEFTRKCHLDVEELNLVDFTELRLGKKFDVIVSNDTLCYFDDPETQKIVLSNFHQNLNPGGVLVMNLPALNQFEGIHDIAVGLKMRFSKEVFFNLVDPEMFEIINARFWPFLLSPVIYIIRQMQMRRIRKNNYEVASDIDIPLVPVNYLLYFLTKLELLIMDKYPFGSSLMVTLKKK
jgi:SAM-dependent methyltransferase